MATTGNEIEPSATKDHVRNEEIFLDTLLLMLNEDVRKVKIPRVPKILRLGHDDAYEPMIISIGPYHQGKPRLKDMEEHKQINLRAFLSRCQISYDQLENKIKEDLEEDLRSCYSEGIGLNKKNREFVNMMILDGCFIVEYFLLWLSNRAHELSKYMPHELLEYDLLLLENQVPFILLEHIFDYVIKHQHQSSQLTFIDLCINYFKLKTEIKPKQRQPPNPEQRQPPKPVHLLHLYHSTLSLTGRKREQREKKVPIMIPRATVLQKYGITFKKNMAENSSILDIKFSKANGVLEIPPLPIHEFTMFKLRNLIVFEQLCSEPEDGKFHNNFCTYAKFMDYIVNTPGDVALLCKKGILEHHRGSDKDVSNLFNNITIGTFTEHPDNYLSELFKDLKEYQTLFWPKWEANLMLMITNQIL